MYDLPTYTPITLLLCLAIALLFALFSNDNQLKPGILLAVWCLTTVGMSFIPQVNYVMLFVVPCLLLGVLSLLPAGRAFVRGLKDEHLHYLHLWRLPFAFVLLWFYQAGVSSLNLTFEGFNYDIVAGLSAPVIASLAFSQKILNKEIVLGWNGIGLLMLLVSIILLGLELRQSNNLQAAFGSLPYAFALGLLLPLSLFAHALVIYRIIKGYVKIDE